MKDTSSSYTVSTRLLTKCFLQFFVISVLAFLTSLPGIRLLLISKKVFKTESSNQEECFELLAACTLSEILHIETYEQKHSMHKDLVFDQ